MAFNDSVDLLFRVFADSDQAKKELKGFRGEVASEIDAIKSSLVESTGAFGRFAAAAGPAGLAVAGVAAVATAGAAAIFTLAKNAADAGSQIYDLSRNTGISATLLSSLKVAADQSGSSIQEVAQGLSLFNKLIGEANQGSKEATASLKRFGIDPQEALKNSEAAFATVVKRINELPPGIERANAAREAFGRGGAALVSTLETVGGDLDEFIKRMKLLGVVFDDEGARAADEFGDTLDELGVAARGVGQAIGREAIPEITLALRDLSAALQANRGELGTWASEVGNVLRSVRLTLKSFIQTYRDLNPDLLISPAGPIQFIRNLQQAKQDDANQDVIRLGDQIKGRSPESEAFLQEQLRAVGRGRSGGFSTPADKPKKTKKTGGGKSEAEREAEAESRARLRLLENENRDAERFYQQGVDAAKRNFDQRLSSLDDFVKEQIKLEEVARDARLVNIARERNVIASSPLETRDKKLLNADLDQKQKEALANFDKNRQRVQDEATAQERTARTAHRETIERIDQIADERAIERIKVAADAGVVLQSAALKEIERLREEAFQRGQAQAALEVELAGANLERQQEITDKMVEMEARRASAREDATRRIIDATIEEIQFSKNEVPAGQPAADPNVLVPLDEIGNIPKQVLSTSKILKEVFTDLKKVGRASFDDLADGLGQLTANWVLLGNAGGLSLRKLTAQMIASFAQQAIAKAAMHGADALAEVALGIAAAANPFTVALAPGHFAAATAHGTAAAAYGAIGVGSALFGRAVAGDAFSRDARGPSGAPNQSRAAAADRPFDPNAVTNQTEGRATAQTIVLRIEGTPDFTVRQVVENVRNNGALRDVIVETAGARA